MWIFKKEPPPPLPFYKKQPVATAAVILTLIGMFILGPIGAIYNGMTEELKKKANNETVILYMKQQKEKDDQQWKILQNLLNKKSSKDIVQTKSKDKGIARLSPKEFEKYISLKPEIRSKYKKYLEHIGKDVSGLPD